MYELNENEIKHINGGLIQYIVVALTVISAIDAIDDAYTGFVSGYNSYN